jgi:hypothetical protein
MSEKIKEESYQFIDQKIRYLFSVIAIALFIGQFLEFNLPDIGQSFTKKDMFSFQSYGFLTLIYVIAGFVKRTVSEEGLSYVIFGYKTPVNRWGKYKLIVRTDSAIFLETIVRSSDSSDDKIALPIYKIGEKNANLIEKKLSQNST